MSGAKQKPRKRRIPLPWIFGAAAAGLAAWVFSGAGRRVEPSLVCALAPAPFVETVKARGEIDSGGAREVRAPWAPYERQVTWLIPEGASVKKGEIVAQFDVADAESSLDRKRELVTSLGNLMETEKITWEVDLTTEAIRKDQKTETMEDAKRRKDRTVLEPPLPKEIGERTFGVSNLNVEQAGRRILQLEAKRDYELRRRAKHIQYRERRVTEDEEYLEEYVVRAPCDSIVVYPPIPIGGGVIRKVEAGDSLARGQAFMRLPDLSTRVVRLQVAERDLERIAGDRTLTFRARALPGRSFSGTVVSTSNLATESTSRPHWKYFEVVAEIAQEEGIEDLKPGMVVDAEIPVRDHGRVFAIPRDLAWTEPSGQFAIRLAEGENRERTLLLPPGTGATPDFLLVDPDLLGPAAAGPVLRVVWSK